MRNALLAFIGLSAGIGAAALIYRNWRHIVRHPVRLSPATYAIGVERNLGTGDPLGIATTMVSVDQTILHDREHPSALILPVAAPSLT